jgi:hypothetical protein
MVRAKPIRLLIVALISALLLLPGAPYTQAGVCYAADRARVQRLFDYLIWVTQKKLVAAKDHARYLLDRLEWLTLRNTLPLYMNMIRLEARWTMHRLLVIDGPAVDKLTEALQAHADRAQLLLSRIVEHPKIPRADLKRIAQVTAGSLAVCRAVRHKSPDICAALGPKDQGGLRTECESLVVRVGILYQNDCSDDAVSKISKTWGRKADAMREYCRAIKEAQPNLCMEIPGASPLEKIVCRALAGHGESACGDPVFSEETSRDCRNELRIQAVLAGKASLTALPQELRQQELVWPALLAASTAVTCDDLAVDAFEELTAPLNLFNHAFE